MNKLCAKIYGLHQTNCIYLLYVCRFVCTQQLYGDEAPKERGALAMPHTVRCAYY